MKFILFIVTLISLYFVYAKLTYVEEEPYTEAQYLAEYGPKDKKIEVEQPSIILLSRPGCGYCTKAKNLLDSRGVKYTQYNVQTSKKGRTLFKKYKGRGVPLIINGSQVIRGYNAQEISKL